MRSRYLGVILGCAIGLFSLDSQAMLVAYQDSFGIMGLNQANHSELFINYSFTPYFAIGERNIRFDTKDGTRQFFIPEADFLIHRWNQPDSQTNIYAGGGYGVESFQNHTQGTTMANAAVDWESRKYYLDAEFQSVLAADSKSYDSAKFRAGVAPYKGQFNEINSWFILQLETTPYISSTPSLTPMVRLFYKNVLIEIGADMQGTWMFNYMIHI